MRLKSFRVQNYRSITDSGDIDVGQLTALIGQNESGKSNLLRALYSLNPSDDPKVLHKEKDFPRHRALEDCNDNTRALFTTWELDDNDRESIGKLWERGKTATIVRVSRSYEAGRFFGFDGVVTEEFDFDAIKNKVRKIVAAVKAVAADFDETVSAEIEEAVDKFKEDTASPPSNAYAWVTKAEPALDMLRQALASAEIELTEAQDAHITYLEDLAEAISSDRDGEKEARQWVADNLPIFMYLEEYPKLNGYQNINEFLERQEQDNLTSSDKNFEKMCNVAGLQPEKLQELSNDSNSEARTHFANHASRKITKEIRRLWKNRPLNIRFNVGDGQIHTFISDPEVDSKVEINLNDRSRGFKWFFSFYITFAADTKGGDAENAILLLDEPGLHLHAKAQRDLLNHFENDFKNQILYTTHSPFMVPIHRLDIVRTVNAEKSETTVSNDLSGDADTLFPLQAALGYDLSQSLSIGPNNLIVEGHTDFRVLSSISFHLNGNGREGLNDKIVITSVGGAQKIPYMVNFLVSENLNVVVLFDCESGTKTTQEKLVKSKDIKENKIVFISAAFGDSPRKEADIEDLLDPKVYEMLVYKSYEKELKGARLKLNPKIPRIAKRFESAFKEVKLKFNKTRPMWLLLEKMGTSPDEIVTDEVAERFETLFKIINNRFFPKG